MLSREDNELLCRVEGDAPMGRLMRAHWIPACLEEEVRERDGARCRQRQGYYSFHRAHDLLPLPAIVNEAADLFDVAAKQ